ncbi:MAG: class II aldolase/adducin family protein [Actinomycetota bacterium]
MGAGDVSEFRSAGRVLFTMGLVKESEGNLSVFDGERLVITRDGVSLAEIGEQDVLAGSLEERPDGASSDFAVHVEHYRGHGPGAIAHAHPPALASDHGGEGPHGIFAFAPTLQDAVEVIVGGTRSEE